jgi:predicted Zn finger-like uncharacterized protein
MNIKCPYCHSNVRVKDSQIANHSNYKNEIPKFKCKKCSKDFGRYTTKE